MKVRDYQVTGSRAYGEPTPESDLDLALLVDEKTAQFFWEKHLDAETETVRVGPLNLIIFHNKDNFDLWKKVTNELISRAPVTRDEAVTAFKNAGFKNYEGKL